MGSLAPIHVVESDYSDLYQEAMLANYDDPPEAWQKILGGETLSFNGGLFPEDELAAGPHPSSVGPSELRCIDRQLELAGLLRPDAPPRLPLRRILDLGCGWGVLAQRLARVFPDCPRIDAVNLSPSQLRHCAATLPADLHDRVRLLRCNVRDVDGLPDPDVPYDFVFVRGVWFHCLPSVFEASVAGVARRMAPGGLLLLSDPLYEEPGGPAPEGRGEGEVGTEDHKTREYYLSVLEGGGFEVQDMRVLPSNAEMIHWFLTLKANIEANFERYPEGVSVTVRDLHDFAQSFADKVAAEQVSMYTIVAKKAVG
ncbi:methyltransferase type 12 [Cordyceps fumosorosea ARSEF 2679]|uniref:Methyltransferase type 12 n=1 Tax=Cordyceps fumosorosea (strain ARSEF 2679) TaxID=1081104 RepID=A0A162LNQ0_CORFA|nr:methyltransferase type 12 [Cordyceps fumosorosea ARSEF 2679]OAA73404.1 methyltransferase type 12 [Cordyceps fumosorosea ARSEF 2679]